MTRTRYLAIRGILDRIAAAALLVVLALPMAVVAILIQMKLGRPVLFRQTRQGHKGPFSLFKFRTMINDAERIGGGYMAPELNLVPPLGAFLRASSLDELPQLLNILKGDMSFVGPRPALPSQVTRYTPAQRGRLNVPQGITGLAQVRYRNEAPWSIRIEADLEYVRSVGPVTDVRILFGTVGKVFRGSGVRSDQIAADVDDLAPERKFDDEE